MTALVSARGTAVRTVHTASAYGP